MIRLTILALSLAFAASASAKVRIWIDTDPACGLGSMSDPDDCFALLHLLASPSVEIAGISTTFGNAEQVETTAVARELLRQWNGPTPPLFAGAGGAMHWWRPQQTAASHALISALERGPLMFVALGPLTNLSAALAERPSLASRITNLITIMGKEPGELFHPAEGSPRALFGHGPVFSDLNFAKDPRAARAVFAYGIPITLVPYAAGKTQSILRSDLTAIASRGGAMAWVAKRSEGWLAFWRDMVGRDGFYPFDLVAAIVATDPARARCADESVLIADDDKIGWFGFGPRSLLFAERAAPGARSVHVCRSIAGRAAAELLADPTEGKSP